MCIVILNRWGHVAEDYAKWLAGTKLNIRMIAPTAIAQSLRDSPLYASVHGVEDYEGDVDIEQTCHSIAAREPITYIVALQESDLYKAARLREFFNLPGQDPESVEAFRDKVRMKQCLKAADIEVDLFEPVGSYSEALAFSSRVGYPVVLKPRDSAGSVDVQIVASADQLGPAIHNMKTCRLGLRSNVMIERFIPGKLFHVDGFVLGGDLLYAQAFRFFGSQLKFDECNPRGSVAMDPSSLRTELERFAHRAAMALPHPKSFAFHAEIFVRPNGTLVLGEIASRVGGTGIARAVHLACGYSPNEIYSRAQAELSVTSSMKHSTGKTVAWGLIARRQGLIASLPHELPFDWVTDYVCIVQEGQVMQASTNYFAEFLAILHVQGDNEQQAMGRFQMAAAWIRDHVVMAQVQ